MSAREGAVEELGGRRVVLCATDHDARTAVSELDDSLVVATRPQAAAALTELRVDYRAVEDMFDSAALSSYDERLLTFQREWVDQIDSFARSRSPRLAAAQLGPAGLYAFNLKVVCDSVMLAAIGVAAVLAAHPREIVCFEHEHGELDETLFFGAPIHVDVARLLAPVYGVPVQVLRSPGPTQAATRMAMQDRLVHMIGWRGVARLSQLRREGVRGMLPRKEPAALVHQGDVFDLGSVEQALAEAGSPSAALTDLLARVRAPSGSRRLRRELTTLWPELLGLPSFRAAFTWAGADLTDVAAERLEHWWLTLVPQLWRESERARRGFGERGTRAVLFYSPVSAREHAALNGARAAGIPVVTHQHGGFEGNCAFATYDLTDMRWSSERLVYGERTSAYLRGREPGGQGAAVTAVGSGRLDAMRAPLAGASRRGSDGRTVLYAATSYQYDWYLARHSYQPVEYFRVLLANLRVMAQFRELDFVYKPFPERPVDPIAGLLGDECPNCTAVMDRRLPELFATADACIFDIPSTGLLEALLTDKPLFVFADARYVDLLPEARELLELRATVEVDARALPAALEGFLSGAPFTPVAEPDTGFLRAYGTHLDDGRSAERAAAAVRRVAFGLDVPV